MVKHPCCTIIRGISAGGPVCKPYLPSWSAHGCFGLCPNRAAAAPVEWYLLTTAEVSSLEQAEEIIRFYSLRWRVEDIFRVLKSGCKVEELQMQQADRLHLVITLYLVTAWCLMLMTLLGRIEPDLPARVIFTDTELDVLRVYARTYRD